MNERTLTVNAGSSSLKFALFEPGTLPRRLSWGHIDNIGRGDTTLTFSKDDGDAPKIENLGAIDQAGVPALFMDRLNGLVGLDSIGAVGHRLVHGGPKHSRPEVITRDLMAYLNEIVPYAPRHLPSAIRLIEAFQSLGEITQIACFDTHFHAHMPSVAKLLPIPRHFEAKGVRRYGFHGLSYAYLMEELTRLAGTRADGRVILAHLGNGASLAAVKNGRSIDTSMGFTPAAGIPMSTRSGDLDPGIFAYLVKTEHLSPGDIDDMINSKSGLLGLSETSADIRDLLEREATDNRAAEAVAVFCYQIKKCIGAYLAVLGGLDILVFAGGIGEHAPIIRARVCEDLHFLGIEIDPIRNEANEPLISTDTSPVSVRVIQTNEELMIAKAVAEALERSGTNATHRETKHG